MYPCSNDFHLAIANGNEQKALLIFPDCVFTDHDVVIDRGIEFLDNFNTEEDLAIGQAMSNEIRFSLVNEDRLLNNYTFGEFLATLGVYLRTETYTLTTNETARVVVGNNTYLGYSTSPYLKRNSAAIASQPNFAVQSILAYDGKVYAFGSSGQYKVYNESNGVDITASNPVNSFMQDKGVRWVKKGLYYNNTTRILTIWNAGHKDTYEFCPLGWFTAERPKAPDRIQIDLTCFDFMQKFEKDMSGVSVNFPITIKNLFITICQAAGVSYVLPNPFINGDAVIQAKPRDFDNVNMREVLKWIAEAACSNARIDRDGRVVLDWIRTGTGQVFGTGNYSEFNPYWYETKQITKLYNRDTQASTEKTYGSGDEGYLIQDNPLLKGVS